MKKTLSLLAVLALSVPAFSQVAAWQKLEGQHSKITTRLAVAVSDQASWEKVWKEHDSETPVPAVDFRDATVVAVFLGERQTAGTKVELTVQTDALDANRLNVFIKEIAPKAKGFAAQMICQPYAIVKVRKAAVVAFENNGTMSIPENRRAPANPRDETKVRALLETLTAPSFDGVR